MYRDHVPDEMLQIFRRVELVCIQIGEIFAEADFVAVDFVGVHPDAVLREFRIVKLRAHPIGIVIHPDAAQQKRPFGNVDCRRTGREFGDGRQVFAQFGGRRRTGGAGRERAVRVKAD